MNAIIYIFAYAVLFAAVFFIGFIFWTAASWLADWAAGDTVREAKLWTGGALMFLLTMGACLAHQIITF